MNTPTRRYESLDKLRDTVRRAAKRVSDLAGEVSGRGTVTNEDAQTMRFPRADLVYFDPPYFKRDKGAVHYFQKYRVENSLLLGRGWREANPKPEDMLPVLDEDVEGERPGARVDERDLGARVLERFLVHRPARLVGGIRS